MMHTELQVLQNIGSKFRLQGEICACVPIGNGKINRTFCVTYRNQDTEKNYIFQKINSHVFRSPKAVMRNIELVTEYIRSHYPHETTLHFHHTADGCNYFHDSVLGFWRVMNAIDAVTCDTCEDMDMIQAAGWAFGHFQKQLSEFDGTQLSETIPDFHNTRKRLETLQHHAAETACTDAVSAMLAQITAYKETACELCDRFANGEFPVRVTHNDTKCSNVLFHRTTKQAVAVIDLDTVMPGMAMYDFGDAVRSIAVSSDGKPVLHLGKFRAFSEGYLKETAEMLTQAEREALPKAVLAVTVELASRYLDDAVTGAGYFKESYPQQNLARAGRLLILAEDVLQKQTEMQRILAMLTT